MGGLTQELWLLLAPLMVLIVALAGVALWDLKQRQRVTGNNKMLWAFIIVLVQIFGPLAYFLFGRKD